MNVAHAMENTPSTSVPKDNNEDSNFVNFFNPLPLGAQSPIDSDILQLFLSSHPDQALVSFLLEGFTNRFDIGYRGPFTQEQSRNLLSARESISPVTEAI